MPTACLAESLRLRQVRLAALQLVSQLLLLGHIHGGAKKPFEKPVVEDWNANASNIANRAVRSDDPLRPMHNDEHGPPSARHRLGATAF